MSQTNPILSARSIRKTFGKIDVLKGIDIDVYPGEIVAIVGPSGAGKTTLLQILGLLDDADPGGSLSLKGQDVARLARRRLAEERNKSLGFVFQAHLLLPEFTAIENVMIPALIGNAPRSEAKTEAERLLAYMGLADRFEHKPSELSGGERQRVAVARALINKPALILADEPTGSLDMKHKQELHSLFFRLRNEIGQTFLVVTHDDSFAKGCDRIIHLTDGLVTNEQ